jgi:hypothetical protein
MDQVLEDIDKSIIRLGSTVRRDAENLGSCASRTQNSTKYVAQARSISSGESDGVEPR